MIEIWLLVFYEHTKNTGSAFHVKSVILPLVVILYFLGLGSKKPPGVSRL